MTHHTSAWEAKQLSSIEDAAYGLGLAGVDPASLGAALRDAALRLARQPGTVTRAAGELVLGEAEVALDVARAALGAPGEPVEWPQPGDKRFDDRAWRDNPLLRGALQTYLLSARVASELLDEAELDPAQRRKARFALRMLLDALAPSNVPWLNPSVVKEAIDTGGLSAVRGVANFVQDLVRNHGRPQQVDREPFELGTTLAATPGRVVYRNELFELLAYEPQTETVFAEPFVYSPPWVNKYYVMDLAPGRSFVEHAVRNGFTVFAMSYRNPDTSMRNLTLDDYLRDGLLTALDRVSELTGAPRMNVVGVCTGGVITALALGVLNARGEADRIGWASLVVTLIDHAEPGDLGIFTDEQTIERLERRIEQRGYWDSAEMARTFDFMKGNDLVWNYVVANWYQGRKPPPFDILAWNADGTRLPGKMHAEFLRACYVHNLLAAPGAYEIDGAAVDLSRVETPLFVLSAERDHIAPWTSAYRTTQVFGGEATHVLTGGGHIAGMVNPPGPKAYLYRRDDNPPDANDWLRGAERVQRSWWEEWTEWASARSGGQVAPPVLPDGEAAPGRYVRS